MNGAAQFYVDGEQVTCQGAGCGVDPIFKTQSEVDPARRNLSKFSTGFGPAFVRLTGLGEGAHEVQIKVTSSGALGRVYFDWAAPAVGGSTVFVGPPTRMTAAEYERRGIQTHVALSYQEAAVNVAEMLMADGLDVYLVDTDVLNAMDFSENDGVHPSDFGQRKIGEAFVSKIRQVSASQPAA